jgi:hypothetical protein
MSQGFPASLRHPLFHLKALLRGPAVAGSGMEAYLDSHLFTCSNPDVIQLLL